MRAPIAVRTAAAIITVLQGSGPRPLIRWGRAEPRVRAPSSTPNARPRSVDSDQEAMSFMPTGYTPASRSPVRNLSGIAAERLFTNRANRAVHTAAPNALAASRYWGAIRSARLNRVEVTAPATNPICTEAVSQTAAVDPIPHSDRRLGTTAVAENQTHSPSTCTMAMRARC